MIREQSESIFNTPSSSERIKTHLSKKVVRYDEFKEWKEACISMQWKITRQHDYMYMALSSQGNLEGAFNRKENHGYAFFYYNF